MSERALIIDNGSGSFKAGFGGEQVPRLVFPSVVGIPNQKGKDDGLDSDQKFYAEEAEQKKGLLTFKYPIKHGVIRDWELMENLWEYTFRSLQVQTSSHPVLLSEPPLNPKRNRERTLQVMFETFGVPCLYIGVQAVLTLYSCGRTTGCGLDSGEGVTYTVPIYGGYAISHAVQRTDYAGESLTEYLKRILTERGLMFTTTAELELVKKMKERLCYFAMDFDEEMQRNEQELEKEFETDDGRIFKLGNERFRCPEALFSPSFLGMESHGVHRVLYNAIMSTDIDLRTDLWQNLVITGGNTLFEGFLERLQRELGRLAPGTTKVRAYRPESIHSAWCGGSLLSSLPAFKDSWVMQEEYDEVGPVVVHRKCF